MRGVYQICAIPIFWVPTIYLGKGRRIQSVLASNLKADGVAGLGVPSGLSTSLNLSVDAVVVAGREDSQVVSSLDSGGVLRNAVADGSGVLGDGGLLDIVATLGTDEEAFVAKNGIEVSRGAVEEIEESTSVQVGLLEVKVELSTLGLLGREVLGNDLSLETLGNVVVELELGVEGVGSSPRLGEGEA